MSLWIFVILQLLFQMFSLVGDEGRSQKSEIGPKERLYPLECPRWEDWTNQ